MQDQKQRSAQELSIPNLFNKLRKLQLTLRWLRIVIFVIAFAIVIAFFIFLATRPPAHSDSLANWNCPAPTRVCEGDSLPMALSVSIILISAIILLLISFAVFGQYWLKKEKRKIGTEISNVPNDEIKSGAVIHIGNDDRNQIKPERDLRIALIKAWIQEDPALKDVLVAMIIEVPHIELLKGRGNNLMRQLEERVLLLEKQLAAQRKQKKDWRDRLSIWASIADNVAKVILAISALLGLAYGIFNLIHH